MNAQGGSRRAWTTAWVGAGVVVLAAVGVLGWLRWMLTPAPGEWVFPVRWRGLAWDVSMPGLVRLSLHPLTLRVVAGQSLTTPWGLVSIEPVAETPQGPTVALRCAPCRLRLAALGPAPLELEQLLVSGQSTGEGRYEGRMQVSDPLGDVLVQGAWQALWAAGGLSLAIDVPATPIRHWAQVLAPTAPELRVARIAGTASAEVRVQWTAKSPRGQWQVTPRINGFVVAGLGTEVLRHATVRGCTAAPPGQAGRPSKPARSRWIERAVVAAEDQHFHEHPGYDLSAGIGAWMNNQSTVSIAGASTLTQQLAKLLFTGEERSLARKLRELLWAVEMDRTLGKARVLALYLAVAPWGDGVCGAEAAAQHYLRKPAARLTPLEAAWLASLLRNPQREVTRWAAADLPEAHRAPLRYIVQGLRGLTPARRRLLMREAVRWRPPGLAGLPFGAPRA